MTSLGTVLAARPGTVHAPRRIRSLFPRIPGGTIRTFVVSLVGVAALAAGLVLIRQHRTTDAPARRGEVPAGETVPVEISLEKLRELGY